MKQLMDSMATQMETTLDNLSTRFPFHASFQATFKRLRLMKRREFEEYLETARNENWVGFSVAKLHYLTTICFEAVHHLHSGIELTEEVLKREPSNFNALWNQAKLRLSEKEHDWAKFKALQDVLSAVAEDELQMLVADIEIATICDTFLDIPCLAKYRRILSIVPNAYISSTETLKFHNRISSVRLRLAHKYVHLMHARRKWKNVKMTEYLFDTVKPLLEYIIESTVTEEGDDEDITEARYSKAKAMKELATANFSFFESCIRNGRIRYGDIKYDFLEKDISFYFLEAIHTIKETNISPGNKATFYFEYGLFLEYCATMYDIDESESICYLQKALTAYKQVLENDPKDDIALYHIGLVYRELWIKEGKHLSTLSRMLSDSRRMMQNRSRGGICDHLDVLPEQTVSPKDIPPPFKMVGLHRLLKSYNFPPQQAFGRPNQHLVNAKNSFKQARELRETGGIKTRLHVVALARSYIGLGKDEKALAYFAEARELNDTFIRGGTLHEQWAMLIDRKIHSRGYNVNDRNLSRERALQYYREAMRYQQMLRSSSMVSLYYFSNLLYEQTQLERHRNDAVLQKEYFLIYKVIQDAKTENDKVPLYIYPEFRNDAKKVSMAWDLIEMLHERSRDDDAAIALTYLFILSEAGVFADHKTLETMSNNGNNIKTSRLVFEISKRAVKTCFLPECIICYTYMWLIRLCRFKTEKHDGNICLIGTSFNNPDFKKAWTILKHCLLQVCDLCIDDYGEFDEIPTGLLDRLLCMFHQVKKVVIVYNPNEQHLMKVVNLILKNRRLMPDRLCVASTDFSGPTVRICGLVLPHWNIRDEIPGTSTRMDDETTSLKTAREIYFYSLMEALFFAPTDWTKLTGKGKTLLYERTDYVRCLAVSSGESKLEDMNFASSFLCHTLMKGEG